MFASIQARVRPRLGLLTQTRPAGVALHISKHPIQMPIPLRWKATTISDVPVSGPDGDHGVVNQFADGGLLAFPFIPRLAIPHPCRSQVSDDVEHCTDLCEAKMCVCWLPPKSVNGDRGCERRRLGRDGGSFGQMKVARQRVVGANTVLKEVSLFQGSFRVNGSYPRLREYAFPGLRNAAPLGLRNRVPAFPGGLVMWRSVSPIEQQRSKDSLPRGGNCYKRGRMCYGCAAAQWGWISGLPGKTGEPNAVADC